MKRLGLLGWRKSMPFFVIRRVVGESMLPTFAPGALIVGLWPRKIQIDDIVIIRHNGLEKTKRVKYLSPDSVFVIGDNPSGSTDSRNFGWLKRTAILAKVVWPNLTRTED